MDAADRTALGRTAAAVRDYAPPGDGTDGEVTIKLSPCAFTMKIPHKKQRISHGFILDTMLKLF